MDGVGEGRRVRSGETWAAAREAYLSGRSAAEVCARFDLGLSAFKARARREGWRRADQADPDPALEEDLDEELEDIAYPDFDLMTERAALMAHRAVMLGDASGAERWARLHARFKATFERLEDEAREAFAREEAARRVRPPVSPPAPRAANPADVHLVHSVHHDSALEVVPPPADAPQNSRRLNRADRRRQARLAAHQDRAAGRAASGR